MNSKVNLGELIVMGMGHHSESLGITIYLLFCLGQKRIRMPWPTSLEISRPTAAITAAT